MSIRRTERRYEDAVPYLSRWPRTALPFADIAGGGNVLRPITLY